MNADEERVARAIAYARAAPKVELHVHIEGTLEPELVFKLAAKNGVDLAPYQSVHELRAAYSFTDLQSFLDIYYLGARVLQDEDDFYELMSRYLAKCRDEHVVHAEIFFDPQTHLQRRIPFEVFMGGFLRAIRNAQTEFGMSVLLIMCFLRHLPEEDAITTLNLAKPFVDSIQAVGLDSSERGFPPHLFQRVYEHARGLGLDCVAHAGEEGPAEYISEALDLLQCRRIDHGIRCVDDPMVMKRLADARIPLTVCPLSNLKLGVVAVVAELPLRDMLDAGLCVTINSDDPAYFGGYINDNFEAVIRAFDFVDQRVIHTLLRNAIQASLLPAAHKLALEQQLDAVQRAPIHETVAGRLTA
ncbi:Adenine deaminase [Porphyridium purpureum]|uniref:Adenine deaminase n=1 Tax=Porphyridium purpureum TaxID=35688 RepID=A0A5J4YZF9_PORPP|nr:Adenine deaminase [Porphyridium purpureum]|eukprot:POR7202..scf208_2